MRLQIQLKPTVKLLLYMWSQIRVICQSNERLEVEPEQSRSLTMKSNISGLLFLILCCSSTVLRNESVVVKNYVHVPDALTWQEAQAHCRSVLHADLATIMQSDTDRILLETYYAWIGFYKPAHWSSEHYTWMSQEYSGEDVDHRECGFAAYNTEGFYGRECKQYLFFICQYSLTPNSWNYTLVPQSKTWKEALEYCRDNFHSLATLEDQTKRNAAVIQRDFPVWIGLHREGEMWKWSRGFSTYRNWASNESEEDGDCVTISSATKKMSTQDCNARFPFVCLRENVILVRENKTWEEALEHCRASSYELLSVQPGEDHRTVMDYVMEAETDKVWTGLRFLAGDWLWMNKATLRYSELPLCPQQGQQCGALAKKDTGSVEGTDCLWKLNFLCYSST